MLSFRLINWNLKSDITLLHSIILDGFNVKDLRLEDLRLEGEVYIVILDGLPVGSFRLINHHGFKGLSDFCIIKDYQRKGIGRSVVNHLRSTYSNLVIIELPEPHLINSLYKNIPIISLTLHW